MENLSLDIYDMFGAYHTEVALFYLIPFIWHIIPSCVQCYSKTLIMCTIEISDLCICIRCIFVCASAVAKIYTTSCGGNTMWGIVEPCDDLSYASLLSWLAFCPLTYPGSLSFCTYHLKNKINQLESLSSFLPKGNHWPIKLPLPMSKPGTVLPSTCARLSEQDPHPSYGPFTTSKRAAVVQIGPISLVAG